MSEMSGDRRNYENLTEALREATKPLVNRFDAHERALEKHAQESRAAFEKHGEKISGLATKLEVAVSKVEAIGIDTKEQWTHITSLKDQDREFKSAVERVEQNLTSLHQKMTGQHPPKPSDNGFWTSPNAKTLLIVIGLSIVVFGGISGYNVLSSDNVQAIKEVTGSND